MFGQQILTTFLQSAPSSLCKMTGKRRSAGIDDVDYLTGAGLRSVAGDAASVKMDLRFGYPGVPIWYPWGNSNPKLKMGILRKS